jgi:hypothetical protein
MELPPELRDVIYEMALIDDNGILLAAITKGYRRTIYRCPYDPGEWHYTRRVLEKGETNRGVVSNELVPNLLAVSKQIHHEAVNMLYGQELMFQDTDALHRFLTIIGPRNAQRLLSIDIKELCRGKIRNTLNHCAFMSLTTATKLKALHLPMDDFSQYTCAKTLARGLFCIAHFFLEAYGAAHGRKDAAIDVIQLDDDTFEVFRPSWRGNTRVVKQHTPEENRAIYRAELCRLLSRN